MINNTHCRCTIPSGKTAGNHSFTVKVRKGNNDIETDDLVITLYDSSKTKITSLTPAEALTDEETTFTFGGSELVNSPTAVCVATVGNVKRSVRASFTGGRYMCTFPAQKKSMSVSLGLSLNGVHEVRNLSKSKARVSGRPRGRPGPRAPRSEGAQVRGRPGPRAPRSEGAQVRGRPGPRAFYNIAFVNSER